MPRVSNQHGYKATEDSSESCRARAKKLSAVFISGDTKNKAKTIANAAKGKYQLIDACPEMMESVTFAPILHLPHIKSRLAAICFDEEHCVVEMGRWRAAYERVKYLRSAVRTKERKIPILATSATLPPHYISELRATLEPDADAKICNLENHRPELSTVVMSMSGPTALAT